MPKLLSESEIDDIRTVIEMASNYSTSALDEKEVGEIEQLCAQAIEAIKLKEEKDNAYKERNMVIAAFCKIWVRNGHDVWLGYTPELEEGWRHCVYVQTPFGQLSWHIRDVELPLFPYPMRSLGGWDGHTTKEKYNRLERLIYES